MKLFFTACLLAAALAGFGQSFLVPYKVGDKYGLSNEKGKLIVNPGYDEIKWLQGYFFETSNQILLNDTLETAPNQFFLRNKKVTVKGILYKNKALLNDEPYSRFEIVANKCIVAKNDSRYTDLTKAQFARLQRKEKFISLFNLEGKNIYPDDFKRLQKFDTAGSSTKNKGHARYILFASENFNKQFSLFVFDADRQDISKWLLKDVAKINITEPNYRSKTIQLEYTDEFYNTRQQLVDYNSGEFLMTTISTPARPKMNTEEQLVTLSDSRLDDDNNVAVPREGDRIPNAPIPEAELRKQFTPYFTMAKDSLFYVTYKNERSFIPLPQDLTPIFWDEKNNQQFFPLVFKQQNRFGLLDKNGPGTTRYDSLVYFGGSYMAANLQNNRILYGIINKEGKETLPLLHDSIVGQVKEFGVDDNRVGNQRNRFLTLKEKETYGSNKVKRSAYTKQADEYILVYKNGKVGMNSTSYGEIIPAIYDTIAQNGLNFIRPRESEYFILKKDGLYGITHVKFNRVLLKYELLNAVATIFTQMPAFFINDYYHIKGLKLFGLYNPQFELAGYATETGVLFSKQP